MNIAKPAVGVWALFLLLAYLPRVALADEGATTPAPQDLEQLLVEAQKILTDNKTPGMALALISPEDGVVTTGIGLADVASGTPATAQTLFRIGSTSKALVAFAALRLAREGRLDLHAPLASLAPEIEFQNPWEATDPVRVVHLLEHTTGFDDIHLTDYWNQDTRPDNLREVLAHDPDSRVSRWRPGTRFAYCNAGPPIVAYIISKLVGMPFEDYVARELFAPLGMHSATYFQPAAGVPAASLYGPDGVTPYEYWHIGMRPSGSVNASARDMAAYLAMHLDRGRVGATQLVHPDDLARMERPATWIGARAGLSTGYGLHNYTTFDEAGWLWHGHNGGVQGGASDFSYQPQHGVGYAFMINATNGEAFSGLTKLLRAYLLRAAGPPTPPPAVAIPDAIAAHYAGFYIPVSPRVELFAPLERLAAIQRLQFVDGKARFADLFDSEAKWLIGVSERTLRREDRAVASLALLEEDDGGTSLVAGTTSFVRVNPLIAYLPLALALLAGLCILINAVFLLVWSARARWGRLEVRPTMRWRAWPFASSMAVLVFLICLQQMLSDDKIFQHYAMVSPWSLALAASSVVALLVPLWALVQVFGVPRGGTHRGVYGLAVVTVVSQAGFMLWFALQGALPLITWT